MKNQKIKVILFDLGEVIFTNDWHYDCPEKFAEYSKYFGINYDQMEIGWKASWPQFETGKINEDEFWTIFLTEADTKKIDLEKAKFLWKKYFAEKPGMLNLLTKLKDNYRLVVFSSTGKEWLDYKIKKYNLNRFFQTYITTAGVGIKKSDLNFFQAALEILKARPEECLLVDDTQKIIDLGKSINMKTIHFKDAKQLENELYKLHILK